jgi:hypothetical protein
MVLINSSDKQDKKHKDIWLGPCAETFWKRPLLSSGVQILYFWGRRLDIDIGHGFGVYLPDAPRP